VSAKYPKNQPKKVKKTLQISPLRDFKNV
jgi:hypothetical protein